MTTLVYNLEGTYTSRDSSEPVTPLIQGLPQAEIFFNFFSGEGIGKWHRQWFNELFFIFLFCWFGWLVFMLLLLLFLAFYRIRSSVKYHLYLKVLTKDSLVLQWEIMCTNINMQAPKKKKKSCKANWKLLPCSQTLEFISEFPFPSLRVLFRDIILLHLLNVGVSISDWINDEYGVI